MLKFIKEGLLKMFQDLFSKDKNRIRSQIPNLLTLVRGVLAPIFIIISLCIDSLLMTIIVIAISALTDLFDGWYARKYGYVSEFGALIDTICDKFFTFCIILPIIKTKPFLFMIIIFLEFCISVINGILKLRGKKVSSSIMGKVKTGVLDTSVVFCYLSLVADINSLFLDVILYISIGFQIMSILGYIINFVRQERV